MVPRSAILVLAILTPLAASAEESLVETLARRLASDDPRERAWGAHLAGENRLDVLVPSLIDVLREEARPDRPHARWVVPVCLHALVRLDAVVPEEALAPHLERHRGECIGLMSSRPSDYRRCLRRLFADGGATTEAWIAAGNLLASIRDRSFAEMLLRGELLLEITVISRPYRGPVGLICSDGRTAAPPDGYPPVPRYALKTYGGGTFLRAIPGPEPIHVYVYRQGGGWGSVGDLPGKPGLRSRWLLALRGRDGAENSLRMTERVRWGGEVPLARETMRLATVLAGRYGLCVEDLVRQGLVPPRIAATLSPRIRIEYVDRRDDRRRPLPEPPRPEFAPSWRPEPSGRISPGRLVF